MRLRNVKNAESLVKNHPLVINEVNEHTFNNALPIHVEIGMGKGDFIIAMSEAHPEINFIGIEKEPSILIRALAKASQPPNLRFICLDAKDILSVFKVRIQVLYLNFSDPWPKKRHAKRRLTHPNFLHLYESLFVSVVQLYLKTDNKALFAYSLVTLSNSGYLLQAVSLDLEHSDIPNIPTEYEKKFTELGETINYLSATKRV